MVLTYFISSSSNQELSRDVGLECVDFAKMKLPRKRGSWNRWNDVGSEHLKKLSFHLKERETMIHDSCQIKILFKSSNVFWCEYVQYLQTVCSTILHFEKIFLVMRWRYITLQAKNTLFCWFLLSKHTKIPIFQYKILINEF